LKNNFSICSPIELHYVIQEKSEMLRALTKNVGKIMTGNRFKKQVLDIKLFIGMML